MSSLKCLRAIVIVSVAALIPGMSLAANPPKLLKSFALPTGRSFVNPGETTALVFTITNPNPTGTLTGLSFTDNLPAGLTVATPNGLAGNCGGAVTAPAGGTTITLSGGVLGTSPNSCAITVKVLASTLGTMSNTSSAISSVEGGDGAPAVASLLVAHTLLVRYAANLHVGDSILRMTNTATQTTATGGLTNICANVFVFSPDEQMIACCSCPLTPDELTPISARNDLINNTLTPSVPNSIVVKLLASYCTACNTAAVATSNVATGLHAWMTTLHALPATPAYGVTETEFAQTALSPAELIRLTSFCGFIQANGSGFGVCRACRNGVPETNTQ